VKKEFPFRNMRKEKRLRALVIDAVRCERVVTTKIFASHKIKSINKNAHSGFGHKAFAKSLSQNLRGPGSWANY
jgi:hypothetical protein